jgi:nucleoside-diphosphate-sugar epimerase
VPSFQQVTGGTGYTGAHIVEQLLAEGDNVRVTVRPGRSSAIQIMFPEAYANGTLETVEMPSLTHGDYSEALNNVSAVIHAARPRPDRFSADSNKETFDVNSL